MPIDESRTFKPVRIALLTVSDTRTSADDTQNPHIYGGACVCDLSPPARAHSMCLAQEMKISTGVLEPEFQQAKDAKGNLVEYVLCNKGL